MQSYFPEEDSVVKQIIEEVNKMDIGQKQKLLVQLRKKEILDKVKRLDEVDSIAKSESMTDEEADIYVSEQRKLKYEQSKT